MNQEINDHTSSSSSTWDNISTIRDFTKSRFFVCLLLSFMGLYFLFLKIDIPFSLTGAENELNILGGAIFICLLAAVFSGCKIISVISGFIFIFIGIGANFINNLAVDSKLMMYGLIYLGIFVLINHNFSEKLKVRRIIFTFFISRLFIGYCFIIYGISKLSQFFNSVETFVNITMNPDDSVIFILSASCILFGIFLMFLGKGRSAIFGMFLLWGFGLFMLLQVPTLILYFIKKEIIKVYYENLAFSWQMIIIVIGFIISGLIFLIALKSRKDKYFRLFKPYYWNIDPLPKPPIALNITMFILSIIMFISVYLWGFQKPLPMFLNNIIDVMGDLHFGVAYKDLADQNYENLYTRLDNDDEYIIIPTLKRNDELNKEAVSYYNNGKYLAALSILQSKNKFELKDYYIKKIKEKVIEIIDNSGIEEYPQIFNIIYNLVRFDEKNMCLEKIKETIPIYIEEAKFNTVIEAIDKLNDAETTEKYSRLIEVDGGSLTLKDIYYELAKDECFINITQDPYDNFTIDVGKKLYKKSSYLSALTVASFNYRKSYDNNNLSEDISYNKIESIKLMNDIYTVINMIGGKKYSYGGDIYAVLSNFDEFKKNFKERETNNAWAKANNIYINTPYTANISAPNEYDIDWFSFNIPNDGIVNVNLYTVKQVDSQNYWDFRIYSGAYVNSGNFKENDENTMLLHDYVSGDDTHTTSGDITLPKGKYYIRIDSSKNWSHDDYRIEVKYSPPIK